MPQQSGQERLVHLTTRPRVHLLRDICQVYVLHKRPRYTIKNEIIRSIYPHEGQ